MTVFLISQTFFFPSTSSSWFLNSSSNQQNIPLWFSFLFSIFPFVLCFNSYFLLQFLSNLLSLYCYVFFILPTTNLSALWRCTTPMVSPASLTGKLMAFRPVSFHSYANADMIQIVIPIRGLFLYLHFLCSRRISISSRLRSPWHLQYWTEYFKEYDILSKYFTKTNIEQTSFNICIKLLQTKTAVYGK